MVQELRQDYPNMEAKISEIHRRIDDHLETERQDAMQLAGVKKDIEYIQVALDRLLNPDPKIGKLAALDEKLGSVLILVEQNKGAVKFVRVLAVVVAMGASAWAWIVAQIGNHWK